MLREVCDAAGAVQRVLVVGKLDEGTVTATSSPTGQTPMQPETGPSEEEEADAAQPFQRLPTQSGKERRSSPRRDYPYYQRIAPCHDGAIPRPADFFDVVCRDISAGGFSFLLDEPPGFTDLVVALGRPPHLTHFVAQVRRVIQTEAEGRRQFLVGCQFRGRLHL
jgi:hypothetical protein